MENKIAMYMHVGDSFGSTETVIELIDKDKLDSFVNEVVAKFEKHENGKLNILFLTLEAYKNNERYLFEFVQKEIDEDVLHEMSFNKKSIFETIDYYLN